MSRRLSLLLPAFLALLIVFSDSRPVAAEARCFQNLRECYGRAAGRSTVWEVWAAGLDCELEAFDCVRRFIIGR